MRDALLVLSGGILVAIVIGCSREDGADDIDAYYDSVQDSLIALEWEGGFVGADNIEQECATIDTLLSDEVAPSSDDFESRVLIEAAHDLARACGPFVDAPSELTIMTLHT